MIYDIELIEEEALRCKFKVIEVSKNNIQIEIMDSIVIEFQNHEDNPDTSLIGFRDVGWHTHGDLVFNDKEGRVYELEYIDLLAQLKAGNVLVCEEYSSGTLNSRTLVHREYSDEIRFMKPGDEIRFRQCA